MTTAITAAPRGQRARTPARTCQRRRTDPHTHTPTASPATAIGLSASRPAAPRLVARGLAVLLWLIGSAYLVQAEQTADVPNLIVMLATPALWAAVIAIPVLAGHALADRQYTAALLLTLAALLGSAYTLSGTLGRQAEARDTRLAAARDADKRRTHVEAQLDEVERILAASRERLARECSTGAGRNCSGIQTVIGLSETAATTHRSELARLGRSAPDAGERRIAAALSAITGRSEPDMRETVALFLPALFGLLLEIAALALAMYGWSTRQGEPRDTRAAGSSGITSGPDNAAEAPDGRKEALLAALLTDLALGRSAGSQVDLCRRFGVARSTMSDWLREWEAAGLIPRRRTVGRCKSVG